ncbi:DNA mismatch repair endonuclease MutL [bacterium]|nr:DNA mismatch repair endonuclease MutL [bacterium]
MGVVRKLPEHVINQIKAGEVVERPASVVKELLENSLDAETQNVEIELIDGGRQLIRISDDGCGMSRDDAQLALERHATSKIGEFDDLLNLSTFGFRGEALPSIAAVSEFTLRTRRSEDSVGIQIHVNHGRMGESVIRGMPVGTEIEVRDLFATVPARRKFMRSTATEFGHIHELVQAMALAYFKVGFCLRHNGRDVFKVASSESPADRFKAMLGSEAAEYVPVNYEKGSFKLEGFLQKPDLARPVPRYFMTFVNGRLVKDRIIRNGVLSGYTGMSMKGIVPACVLFVSVDPNMLDVNAHPNKTEIRFTDPALVQDLVTIALQADLRRTTQNQMLSTLPTAETIVRVPVEARRGEWSPTELKPMERSVAFEQRSVTPPVQQIRQASSFVSPAPVPTSSSFSSSSSSPTAGALSSQSSYRPAETLFAGNPSDSTVSQSDVQSSQRHATSYGPLGHATYLGQFNNCYLLFESGEDLLVVDQHAFHERVLFEELALQIESDQGLARQSLLAPLTVPVPQAIAEVLREEEKSLLRLGFELEILPSGRSVALHSLPTQVETSKAAMLFDDVVSRLLAVKQFSAADAHPLLQRAQRLSQEWLDVGVRPANLSRREIFHLHIATVACHSAVRSGDPMNPELVRRLLLRGTEVDFFAHCPHGRPVWRRWSAKDVAEWFSRV